MLKESLPPCNKTQTSALYPVAEVLVSASELMASKFASVDKTVVEPSAAQLVCPINFLREIFFNPMGRCFYAFIYCLIFYRIMR
ncbi:MAG: hypothetical protein D6714_04700 [Bacteroidetes bacterium]|nr:MAG: hypothetical protein D6714_04700 [Bacteroidota bacterium]